jgi:hypothetical protein
MRWRVERDYEDMKQEVGLAHFEGRTWRGWHHHATLCMAAHVFLALTRAFPPEGPDDWLDDLDSPEVSSAGTAESHWSLPDVPAPLRPIETIPGAVANVIE